MMKQTQSHPARGETTLPDSLRQDHAQGHTQVADDAASRGWTLNRVLLALSAAGPVLFLAVSVLLGLLDPEGVRELVSLNFYGEPGSTQVGAILTFSDRERITEHIAMVSSWEEFERFFATVKPLDVRVYGKLSAEAEAWIGQFGDIVSSKFEEHVAGFVR